MGFWGKCRNMVQGLTGDNDAREVPRGVSSHLAMRKWGIEDKIRYGDDLAFDQGQYNRPLIRPACSPFYLNRRMDLVAPASKTPWPSVNWIPTPPHRPPQITKSGGRQTQQPGPITVQQMQQTYRVVPTLQTGLSGLGDTIRRALGD
jgi:hypothetical protein